jgi:hypothetical protein
MTATTTDEVIPFLAGDGRAGNVLHVVRSAAEGAPPGAPVRGPVLLAHGAGVRANIFRAPVPVTIVDALLDDGFDVWLENWRASIDRSAKAALLEMVAKHGRVVLLVDPAYTTMDCSECGARAKHRLLLSERTYTCEACGAVLPRDKDSAAVMLARAGLIPAGVDRVRPHAA